MSMRLLKWLVLAGILSACLIGLLLSREWVLVPRSSESPPPLSPAEVAAIRAKAEHGDAPAQAQLGRLCENQPGAANRYAEAAKWFGRAAEAGNADAQAGLAELYETGQGVSKDSGKAIELYRRAAEQGHAGAQYALGFDYETGRGVPQDQVQAAKWFRLAAEQGQPLAQYELGQRYDLGVGVPVDRVEALKWLLLAATQGQIDAAARRDQVKKQMTRQEINQAKARVKAFSPAQVFPQ
jgi:uncharacterized protein